MIVSYWKVFEKAGQPGWGVLIPIYNILLLLKIAGKPGWWILLYLIPLVNIVIGIIVCIDIKHIILNVLVESALRDMRPRNNRGERSWKP